MVRVWVWCYDWGILTLRRIGGSMMQYGQSGHIIKALGCVGLQDI